MGAENQDCVPFYLRYIHSGSAPYRGQQRYRKILLTNAIAVIFGFSLIPYIFIFHRLGVVPLWSYVVFLFLTLILVPRMNGFGFYNAARLTVLLAADFSVYVYAAALGPESTIQFYFITLITTPFLLYELAEKKSLFVTVATPVALYFVLYFTDFYSVFGNVLAPPSTLRFLSLNMILSSFASIALQTYYLVRLNIESERQLQAQFDAVASAKQTIETQQVSLMASSKMAALGEMAGGIAHEINNPLAIIQGFSARLRLDVGLLKNIDKSEKDQIFTHLDKMDSTTTRIANIVRGLRDFARDGSLDECEDVSIKKLFNDVISMCSERFRLHGIEISSEAIVDFKIFCRGVQIEQVLLNLLSNSFDAIQKDPIRWIRLESKQKGQFVEISVTDSGRGLSSAVAEKIMQPFFTTKPIGKGTGIGLSISKGLVESNGGKFFYDRHHVNTRFVFTVPLSSALSSAR
jgi:signal transduction histidine kinase